MFYHFKGTSRFFLCKRNVRYCFPWDLRTQEVEVVPMSRTARVGGSGMQDVACTYF